MRDELLETTKSTQHVISHFYDKIQDEFYLSKNQKERILSHFPAPSLPKEQIPKPISEYQHKERIRDMIVLVNDFTVSTASNGNPFLKMKVMNASGSINTKIWSTSDEINGVVSFFENHKCIKISGSVNEYKGHKSIDINSYLPVTENINPLQLLPITDESFEDLTLELFHYASELEAPFKKIILTFMQKYWPMFSINPAAKGHHHAYIGGLLKHTVGLLRVARFITRNSGIEYQRNAKILLKEAHKQHDKQIAEMIEEEVPLAYSRLDWGSDLQHLDEFLYKMEITCKEKTLNKDLLFTAIILHDVGKIYEYTDVSDRGEKYNFLFQHASNADSFANTHLPPQGGITMDPYGSLLSHMTHGILMTRDIIKESDVKLTIEDEIALFHCIESHHGKYEWGSSVTPAIPEAFLLHFCDMLDARFEVYDMKNK